MTRKSIPLKKDGSCPNGYIIRKGYKTKKGTVVDTRCIKNPGMGPGKRADWQREVMKKKRLRQTLAEKKIKGPNKCPKGMILRRGYIKDSYIRKGYYKKTDKGDKTKNKTYIPTIRVKKTIVGAKCIKDVGEKGKGKFIVYLKPGRLGKYGYKDIKNITQKSRQNALALAINEYGPLSVMRRINILFVMNKNRPELRKIYEYDKKWIYKNYDVVVGGKKK
jgi:hypothetical protein